MKRFQDGPHGHENFGIELTDGVFSQVRKSLSILKFDLIKSSF